MARLRTRWLINASGLSAAALAGRIDGFPPEHVIEDVLRQGHALIDVRLARGNRTLVRYLLDGDDRLSQLAGRLDAISRCQYVRAARLDAALALDYLRFFVRWGRLYRSAVLAYLTADDETQLNALGIRVVCDFRNTKERQREAVRWMRPGLEVLSWDYDHRLVSLRSLLGNEELTPAACRAVMLRLYRALPGSLAAPYAALFARLASGDLPLVFACAAGKDRTGLVAALVLTSLRVPREIVMEDFRLTDHAVDLERVLTSQPERGVRLDAERRCSSSRSRSARRCGRRIPNILTRPSTPSVRLTDRSTLIRVSTLASVSLPVSRCERICSRADPLAARPACRGSA